VDNKSKFALIMITQINMIEWYSLIIMKFPSGSRVLDFDWRESLKVGDEVDACDT
jgi:hypothetical protein